ncbi:MAG TPA: hypothetical protein GXX47_02275 [Firmicutes bacterium]|nr:hypothetical protein [Bacillota bacterium]
MWWKLLIGAVIGLAIGHFAAPGYWFWVVIGLIAGCLAELWAKRRESSGGAAD